MLVPQQFTIAISNLPAETDEPALIRLMTARGIKNSDLSKVCIEIANSNSAKIVLKKDALKKNLKRKLSYQVSFKSEAEMVAAIKMLKSKTFEDGFDFEVCAVLPDPSAEVVVKPEDESNE